MSLPPAANRPALLLRLPHPASTGKVTSEKHLFLCEEHGDGDQCHHHQKRDVALHNGDWNRDGDHQDRNNFLFDHLEAPLVK